MGGGLCSDSSMTDLHYMQTDNCVSELKMKHFATIESHWEAEICFVLPVWARMSRCSLLNQKYPEVNSRNQFVFVVPVY